MIKPEAIPQYTGNLPQLEREHAALKKDAAKIRETGSDIHSQFQGLSAYYKAPEAEQLFASTKPVKDRADGFAEDLETVSSALADYAREIRPLVKKLEELKVKAQNFVSENADDDEWQYDGDKVDEHNALRDEITATVAAFWAAERTCHNKITALWGGTQMVAGDGSDRKDQYGFNADDMKNAKVPWGDPVEEKHHWYEAGHWVKSFVWDGLIVDGVWGTVKGLGTLVGFSGWDSMKQAWKGLAQLGTGLAMSAGPGAVAFWATPEDKLPSWLRESRTAMKETGKSLVAWDEWGRNPGRAAGATTFNVVTTVLTGGAGGAASGAGKAGAVARTLSAAGKAGRVIDPMTYIAKGAGTGLAKVGDITKGLRGVGNIDVPGIPDEAITLPEGSVRLSDGAVRLPEGAQIPEGAVRLDDGSVRLPEGVPALPEGTVKLPTEAGAPAQYLDPDGNILDGSGDVVRHTDLAPRDIVGRPGDGAPASAAEPPRAEAEVPAREPALVGAGANRVEGTADLGRTDGSAPGGGGADDVGRGSSGGHEPPASGHGDDFGRRLSASHEPTGSRLEGVPSGHDGPSGRQVPGEGHEGLPAVGGHGDGPTGGGHDGSGGGAERPEFSEGDETPSPPTGGMDAGQEARVGDALRSAKMQPQDLQRALVQLRKSEYGAGIAEHIARGDLAGMPGYRDLLAQCKQGDMTPSVYMAMEHAAELQARGAKNLAFEYKRPELGLDLDVLIKSGDRIEYAAQLKDVKSADGVNSATKGIAAKQLAGPVAGQKVAILDIHDTKAALADKILRRVAGRAAACDATFLLRFEDGSITVPANGPVHS